MKNLGKKLIVTSLSTVMGVSMVASVVGTIAWYQFNTRATATVLGTNVSESGVLQISKDGTNWTRDLITNDLIGGRANGTTITPVTFGEMNADGSLPAQAYKRPDASENPYATNPGSYAEVYEAADAAHDYIQYSVYLRTMVSNNGGSELVSLPVFLSDVLLNDVGGAITEGLRFHLAIDEDGDDVDDKFFLVSENKIEDLALFGVLDLDADGKADVKGGYETVANRDKVVYYGNEGEYQTTMGLNDIVAPRVNGNIDEFDPANHNKVLLHTSTDGVHPSKVTVTLWFEGWDNNVDDMEIEAREVIYQVADYVHAQDVDGLFTEDAGVYTPATGKAVDGTSYYDVFYKPHQIDDFELLTADLFTEAAGVYSKVDLGATPVAQPGVKYYEQVVTDVTANVRVPQSVTGFYTKDGNNYIEITDVDAVAVDGTNYYEKLSSGETYVAVVLEDANHDPLPAGTVDVSNYYTQDLAGNYIHASGDNLDGITYYELTSAGTVNVPTWDNSTTDGAGFQFGLTFDVGRDAFVK